MLPLAFGISELATHTLCSPAVSLADLRPLSFAICGQLSGLPVTRFDNAARSVAEDFRARVFRAGRDNPVGDFPMEALANRIGNDWRGTAIGLYRNWISYLKERKRSSKATATTKRARRLSA